MGIDNIHHGFAMSLLVELLELEQHNRTYRNNPIDALLPSEQGLPNDQLIPALKKLKDKIAKNLVRQQTIVDILYNPKRFQLHLERIRPHLELPLLKKKRQDLMLEDYEKYMKHQDLSGVLRIVREFNRKTLDIALVRQELIQKLQDFSRDYIRTVDSDVRFIIEKDTREYLKSQQRVFDEYALHQQAYEQQRELIVERMDEEQELLRLSLGTDWENEHYYLMAMFHEQLKLLDEHNPSKLIPMPVKDDEVLIHFLRTITDEREVPGILLTAFKSNMTSIPEILTDDEINKIDVAIERNERIAKSFNALLQLHQVAHDNNMSRIDSAAYLTDNIQQHIDVTKSALYQLEDELRSIDVLAREGAENAKSELIHLSNEAQEFYLRHRTQGNPRYWEKLMTEFETILIERHGADVLKLYHSRLVPQLWNTREWILDTLSQYIPEDQLAGVNADQSNPKYRELWEKDKHGRSVKVQDEVFTTTAGGIPILSNPGDFEIPLKFMLKMDPAMIPVLFQYEPKRYTDVIYHRMFTFSNVDDPNLEPEERDFWNGGNSMKSDDELEIELAERDEWDYWANQPSNKTFLTKRVSVLDHLKTAPDRTNKRLWEIKLKLKPTLYNVFKDIDGYNDVDILRLDPLFEPFFAEFDEKIHTLNLLIHNDGYYGSISDRRDELLIQKEQLEREVRRLTTNTEKIISGVGFTPAVLTRAFEYDELDRRIHQFSLQEKQALPHVATSMQTSEDIERRKQLIRDYNRLKLQEKRSNWQNEWMTKHDADFDILRKHKEELDQKKLDYQRIKQGIANPDPNAHIRTDYDPDLDINPDAMDRNSGMITKFKNTHNFPRYLELKDVDYELAMDIHHDIETYMERLEPTTSLLSHDIRLFESEQIAKKKALAKNIPAYLYTPTPGDPNAITPSQLDSIESFVERSTNFIHFKGVDDKNLTEFNKFYFGSPEQIALSTPYYDKESHPWVMHSERAPHRFIQAKSLTSSWFETDVPAPDFEPLIQRLKEDLLPRILPIAEAPSSSLVDITRNLIMRVLSRSTTTNVTSHSDRPSFTTVYDNEAIEAWPPTPEYFFDYHDEPPYATASKPLADPTLHDRLREEHERVLEGVESVDRKSLLLTKADVLADMNLRNRLYDRYLQASSVDLDLEWRDLMAEQQTQEFMSIYQKFGRQPSRNLQQQMDRLNSVNPYMNALIRHSKRNQKTIRLVNSNNTSLATRIQLANPESRFDRLYNQFAKQREDQKMAHMRRAFTRRQEGTTISGLDVLMNPDLKSVYNMVKNSPNNTTGGTGIIEFDGRLLTMDETLTLIQHYQARDKTRRSKRKVEMRKKGGMLNQLHIGADGKIAIPLHLSSKPHYFIDKDPSSVTDYESDVFNSSGSEELIGKYTHFGEQGTSSTRDQTATFLNLPSKLDLIAESVAGRVPNTLRGVSHETIRAMPIGDLFSGTTHEQLYKLKIKYPELNPNEPYKVTLQDGSEQLITPPPPGSVRVSLESTYSPIPGIPIEELSRYTGLSKIEMKTLDEKMKETISQLLTGQSHESFGNNLIGSDGNGFANMDAVFLQTPTLSSFIQTGINSVLTNSSLKSLQIPPTTDPDGTSRHFGIPPELLTPYELHYHGQASALSKVQRVYTPGSKKPIILPLQSSQEELLAHFQSKLYIEIADKLTQSLTQLDRQLPTQLVQSLTQRYSLDVIKWLELHTQTPLLRSSFDDYTTPKQKNIDQWIEGVVAGVYQNPLAPFVKEFRLSPHQEQMLRYANDEIKREIAHRGGRDISPQHKQRIRDKWTAIDESQWVNAQGAIFGRVVDNQHAQNVNTSTTNSNDLNNLLIFREETQKLANLTVSELDRLTEEHDTIVQLPSFFGPREIEHLKEVKSKLPHDEYFKYQHWLEEQEVEEELNEKIAKKTYHSTDKSLEYIRATYFDHLKANHHLLPSHFYEEPTLLQTYHDQAFEEELLLREAAFKKLEFLKKYVPDETFIKSLLPHERNAYLTHIDGMMMLSELELEITRSERKRLHRELDHLSETHGLFREKHYDKYELEAFRSRLSKAHLQRDLLMKMEEEERITDKFIRGERAKLFENKWDPKVKIAKQNDNPNALSYNKKQSEFEIKNNLDQQNMKDLLNNLDQDEQYARLIAEARYAHEQSQKGWQLLSGFKHNPNFAKLLELNKIPGHEARELINRTLRVINLSAPEKRALEWLLQNIDLYDHAVPTDIIDDQIALFEEHFKEFRHMSKSETNKLYNFVDVTYGMQFREYIPKPLPVPITSAASNIYDTYRIMLTLEILNVSTSYQPITIYEVDMGRGYYPDKTLHNVKLVKEQNKSWNDKKWHNDRLSHHKINTPRQVVVDIRKTNPNRTYLTPLIRSYLPFDATPMVSHRDLDTGDEPTADINGYRRILGTSTTTLTDLLYDVAVGENNEFGVHRNQIVFHQENEIDFMNLTQFNMSPIWIDWKLSELYDSSYAQEHTRPSNVFQYLHKRNDVVHQDRADLWDKQLEQGWGNYKEDIQGFYQDRTKAIKHFVKTYQPKTNNETQNAQKKNNYPKSQNFVPHFRGGFTPQDAETTPTVIRGNVQTSVPNSFPERIVQKVFGSDGKGLANTVSSFFKM
jgi:hypothetical protein